jgi:hypothetical protein
MIVNNESESMWKVWAAVYFMLLSRNLPEVTEEKFKCYLPNIVDILGEIYSGTSTNTSDGFSQIPRYIEVYL